MGCEVADGSEELRYRGLQLLIAGVAWLQAVCIAVSYFYLLYVCAFHTQWLGKMDSLVQICHRALADGCTLVWIEACLYDRVVLCNCMM